MSRGRRCALVIAAVALAACASPPLVWHTLVKPAPGHRGGEAASTAASAAPRANHVFEFAVPGVPVQVDRAELVFTDAAAASVRVFEGDRWLAPLPEEVRGALARGYARAGGARDATGLPRPQGAPVLRIRTMLRRFEIGSGGAALDAEWSLQLVGDDSGARDAPLCRWSGTTTARGASLGTQPSTAIGAGVSAMQELLDTLAAAIAVMGNAWVADAATPCPAAAGAAALRG